MRGLWLVGLVIVGAACSGGGYEETLVDTTGARVQRSCSKTDCDYTFLDDPGCGGGTPGLLGGRFITVCSATNGAIFMENCRAITCTSDKTCDIFSTPFECRSGLCERTEWSFEYDGAQQDVAATCFADVPRGDTCRTSLTPESSNPATGTIESSCVDVGECSFPAECAAP